MRPATLALLAALLLPAAATAGDGEALLPYVPAEATMIVGFDGVALRDSATFQRFYGMISEADTASDTLAHLRELGVDPASMIDSAVYAALSLDEDEDDVALLVQFDESVDSSTLDARLAEWATEVEEFLGASCYSHEAGYTVARVSDRIMIAAPAATVRGAIAAAADGEVDDAETRAVGLNETMAELVSRADRTGLLWMAIAIPEDSADPWLAPIRSLTASLDVGSSVDIGLRLTSADAETAAAQAAELRAGTQRLSSAAEVRALGLDAVLDAVTIEQTDADVTVGVVVDEATWTELLEMASAVVESELR